MSQSRYDTVLRYCFILINIEIFLISWFASGTRVAFFIPIFIVGILSCLPLFLEHQTREVLKNNPIVWCGVLWSCVGIIQFLNPNMEVIHGNSFQYVSPLKHIENIPTSCKQTFSDGNSLTSIAHILATCLFATAVYCVCKKDKFIIKLLQFFCINATVMAIFAILQKLKATPAMYGVLFSNAEFYGTFFLSNAAGAFLNMGATTCFAIALMKNSKKYFSLYALMGIICSLSAIYSASKFALVSVFLTIIGFAVCWQWNKFKVIYQKKYLLFLFIIGGILIGYIFVNKKNDYPTYNSIEKKFSTSLEQRTYIYKKSIPILKDNYLYGVGGNSFFYQIAPILMKEQSNNSRIIAYHIPKHAHSDLLNYILEYGILGLIFISIIVGYYVYRIFKNFKVLNKVNFMLLWGIFICSIHSLFDMHLSIISTMIAFILLLEISVSDLKLKK